MKFKSIEHSAILLTFIKLPFVITIFVLSIFEWPFYTDFIVLIFFHILVLQQYWVLMESRIPLKPVLRGIRIVALSISSYEQTQ